MNRTSIKISRAVIELIKLLGKLKVINTKSPDYWQTILVINDFAKKYERL